MSSNTLKISLALSVVILTGCDVNKSNQAAVSSRVDELKQLAYSQEAEGNTRIAIATVDEALELMPDNVSIIEYKMGMLWNLFCEDKLPDELLAFCDNQITQKTASEVMFRLMKAEVYQTLGARYAEDYSVEIIDREKCLAAISELEIAVNLEPNIATIAEEKDWLPLGWDEHFDCLKDFPEFQALGM